MAKATCLYLFLLGCLIASWQSFAQMPMTGAGVPLKTSSSAPTTMYTPLIASTVPASATATRYFGLASGSSSTSYASVSIVSPPSPIAGTISNLSVSLPSAVAAGTWKIVLNKGGSDQTLTCSITSSATSCTDNTDSVSVNVGDLLAWATEPSGSATAEALVHVAATFTATTGISPIFAANEGNAQPSASVDNFTYFGGTGSGWQTTELLGENVIPTAGTIDNLQVATNGTVSPGTYAITIYHNTTATSLTCTISSASPCSDTNGAHAFTVAAGDTISVNSHPASSPTARFLNVSARWTPTINGEALLFGTIAGTMPNASGTRYVNMSGSSNGTITTEATANNLAGSIFTVKKLTVQQQPQPGTGVTRSINLRAGAAGVGTPSAVSCTVSAGTGATGTCSDATNSYTTAATDLMDYQTTVSGTNTALTQFTISAVAYQAP